jgi:hypothetical protein
MEAAQPSTPRPPYETEREKFHEWYRGALEIINSTSPDKVAQAAHSILMFMRHWLAGVLAKESPALFRDLPESFKVGHPLPMKPNPWRKKTPHPGPAPALTRTSFLHPAPPPSPIRWAKDISRPTGEELARGRTIVRVSSTAANCWRLAEIKKNKSASAAKFRHIVNSLMG